MSPETRPDTTSISKQSIPTRHLEIARSKRTSGRRHFQARNSRHATRYVELAGFKLVPPMPFDAVNSNNASRDFKFQPNICWQPPTTLRSCTQPAPMNSQEQIKLQPNTPRHHIANTHFNASNSNRAIRANKVEPFQPARAAPIRKFPRSSLCSGPPCDNRNCANVFKNRQFHGFPFLAPALCIWHVAFFCFCELVVVPYSMLWFGRFLFILVAEVVVLTGLWETCATYVG